MFGLVFVDTPCMSSITVFCSFLLPVHFVWFVGKKKSKKQESHSLHHNVSWYKFRH